MQDRNSHSWLVPATVSLTLIPTVAAASGFALLEQSASRLGTAFAGTAAAADDATTVYFNPAGMTALRQPEGVVSASGIEIASEFRNDSSTAAFAQPLGGNGCDAGDWNLVPAAYFVLPVGDSLAFGFGVNAPFGLKLVYEDGWIGRFQALHNEIKTLNFNPSVAWRINERISIGAGIDYQRLDAELTNDVNYSAVIAQGVQQLVLAGQLPPATGNAVIAANAAQSGTTMHGASTSARCSICRTTRASDCRIDPRSTTRSKARSISLRPPAAIRSRAASSRQCRRPARRYPRVRPKST
jgi:long-chain fatty acid transport protein